MTVLLVSPFIDPDSVGEPRWCYDLAQAISSRVPTVIVSQTPRNRSYKIAELFPGCEVHEHAPWQMDYVPKRIHALFKPNYVRFYTAARAALRRLDPARFRCAHQFGPLALRFPTPLQGLGIPYVVGPLGGSLPTPPAFAGERARQPWYYRFRDLDGLRFRHDPLLRASYRDAACVVGVAPYVRDLLEPAVPLQRFETWPEIAARPPVGDIDAVLAKRAARPGPVRLLAVSRLIFSKGVQFALRALARVPADLDWRLDVLGDGPLRPVIEQLVAELGLGARVTIHGHVPRTTVETFYRDADVFLFPSIREPSGAVVFEAMSWGLPMIAADYGGPARHVREPYGIKVPIDRQDGFIDGLASAVGALVRDPGRRAAMSRAALHAAREEESMAAMARYFIDLYDRVGAPVRA